MHALFGAFLTSTAFFASNAAAHSWTEQLALINEKGQFTGANGYPRGYYARGVDLNDDDLMTFQIPSDASGRLRIDNTDLLCHPNQRQPVQRDNDNFPRLKVAPGSWIAMKYLENGHVTQPYVNAGKPPHTGTVFVFGTTQPRPDEKLAEVLLWDRKGTGGDGRGKLLTAQNFDDGRCHQKNYDSSISMERMIKYGDFVSNESSDTYEQWCETDVQMPRDLKPGQPLTLYWVWEWPTAVNTIGVPFGKDQYYTTCSDVDVVDKAPEGTLSKLLPQQDGQVLAVKNHKSRVAHSPNPVLQFAAIAGNKNYLNPSSISATTTITATTPLPPAELGLTINTMTTPSTVLSVAMISWGATTLPTTLATSTMPAAPVPATPTPAPAAPIPSTPAASVPVAPAPGTGIVSYSLTNTTPYMPTTPVTSTPYVPPTPSAPVSSPGGAANYQYSSIPLADAQTSATYNTNPQPANVMTSIMTITITASMQPTQSMLIVTGSHIVTFVNTAQQVKPRATGKANFHRMHATPRRRRLAAQDTPHI